MNNLKQHFKIKRRNSRQDNKDAKWGTDHMSLIKNIGKERRFSLQLKQKVNFKVNVNILQPKIKI